MYTEKAILDPIKCFLGKADRSYKKHRLSDNSKTYLVVVQNERGNDKIKNIQQSGFPAKRK